MNLVADIKKGEIIAFETAYFQFHEKLYFFILKRTGSVYLTEETVQETFIKLWRYRLTLDDKLPFSIQLFRIARTTLIDILRKQNSFQKLKFFAGGRTKDISPGNTTEEQIDASELNKRLWMVIDKMPPVRKKVFELSRLNGLSYKQIADELSLSVKTVENHIAIAIKQLRRFLGLLIILAIFGK